MVTVDIACDFMDVDETGYVWTFLHEARDPALIQRGAIVVAGDSDAPALAEVIDVVERPFGEVVHLRVLPGAIEDYAAVVQRAVSTAQHCIRAFPRMSQKMSCSLPGSALVFYLSPRARH